LQPEGAWYLRARTKRQRVRERVSASALVRMLCALQLCACQMASAPSEGPVRNSQATSQSGTTRS
jgi:hypothetical protein